MTLIKNYFFILFCVQKLTRKRYFIILGEFSRFNFRLVRATRLPLVTPLVALTDMQMVLKFVQLILVAK